MRPRSRWAFQHVAVGGAESVVFFWLPAPRFGRETAPVRLRGLDPAARYRGEATGEVQHGAVLLGHGLRQQMPSGDCASAVVHLVRVVQAVGFHQRGPALVIR
ncbi:GH36 C-terminal domain-containing protein [Micromonospora sp. NPDC004540]|uniref:GH36 C-terminal domain-containing protein n=1 Tax=Micromonospora sp. NPDC004540 TaxID=3154457 RepID=UPI00339F25F8